MTDLRQRLAALAPEQRAALLRQLLRQATQSPIAPQPRDGRSFPLAPAQEPFWSGADEDPIWRLLATVAFAMRLPGDTDPRLLARMLDEIGRRHEILRTTFAKIDGEPRQLIHPEPPPFLELIELGDDDPAELERRIQAAAWQPFDPERLPLLRVTLLRTPTEWHGVFAMHHLLIDDWSPGVLLAELQALGAAFGAGRPSPLPALPVQVADVAAWQRTQLPAALFEPQVAYWRERLAGKRFAAPADRQRQGAYGPAALFRRALPPELLPAARALCQREGLTLFALVLALFAALLGRRGGMREVLISTMVTERRRPELRPLLGCFVNTVTLALEIDETAPIRALLAAARGEAAAAFENADVPRALLARRLAAEGIDLRETTDTLLLMRDPQGLERQLPPALSGYRRLFCGLAMFPLELQSIETEAGWELTMIAMTERFDAATIDGLLLGLERLIAAATADPDQPLAAVALG